MSPVGSCNLATQNSASTAAQNDHIWLWDSHGKRPGLKQRGKKSREIVTIHFSLCSAAKTIALLESQVCFHELLLSVVHGERGHEGTTRSDGHSNTSVCVAQSPLIPCIMWVNLQPWAENADEACCSCHSPGKHCLNSRGYGPLCLPARDSNNPLPLRLQNIDHLHSLWSKGSSRCPLHSATVNTATHDLNSMSHTGPCTLYCLS